MATECEAKAPVAFINSHCSVGEKGKQDIRVQDLALVSFPSPSTTLLAQVLLNAQVSNAANVPTRSPLIPKCLSNVVLKWNMG